MGSVATRGIVARATKSVDGVCVDAPTEPAEGRAAFAAKVPVKSYPVREAVMAAMIDTGQRRQMRRPGSAPAARSVVS